MCLYVVGQNISDSASFFIILERLQEASKELQPFTFEGETEKHLQNEILNKADL